MNGEGRLRVTLLDDFRVSRGGTTLPVPGARLRALVVRLALAGGREVERSGLVDAIWAEPEDLPAADPAHALQALVSRLRRTLGPAGVIARPAGGYRLAVEPTDVDVLRFERLAAEGRDRLRAGGTGGVGAGGGDGACAGADVGDPAAAAALLGEAVALWGDRPGTEPVVVAAVVPAAAVRLARASVIESTEVGAALPAAIGLRGPALFEASARLRGTPVGIPVGIPVGGLAGGPAGGPAVGQAGEPTGEPTSERTGERTGELDVLADQLDGRESLLVDDNCEHLVDAVAHLVTALLTRCAELRVPATSREPLAVDGEALVPLGPLALPAPRPGIEQAHRTESVRLFAERAAAVRPGFAVDGHNLGEVLRVVHSLDGMPLALELAAARLRTLPLAQAWPPGCPTASTCSPPAAAPPGPGTARCARSSRGAGTSSTRTHARSRNASRSFPVASPRSRRPPSAPGHTCLPPTHPSCSRASSTDRCCSSRRTPAATGCWRRSARTVWSAWRSTVP